jgi:hypothetical protein
MSTNTFMKHLAKLYITHEIAGCIQNALSV